MSDDNEKAVQAPYNANPDLVKMREDIANRNYNLTVKNWVVTGATVAVGAVAGLALLPVIGIAGVIGGAAVGLMLGGSVAGLATMKDRKKLDIDQEMVDSYMSGKNYWGEGYRKEVAEYGYGGEQLPAPRNNLPREAAIPPRGNAPGR